MTTVLYLNSIRIRINLKMIKTSNFHSEQNIDKIRLLKQQLKLSSIKGNSTLFYIMTGSKCNWEVRITNIIISG